MIKATLDTLRTHTFSADALEQALTHAKKATATLVRDEVLDRA